MRFSYDNKKWNEAAPIQDATAVTINWLSKKSGGLMASCYLGVYQSDFGSLSPNDIHRQMENVGKSTKNNELKRAFEYTQLFLENRYVDNHPVIFLGRNIKIKSFNGVKSMNVYSLITAWNNNELMFSCSSTVPTEFPNYKDAMEEQLFNVLKTLQFDR